MPGARFINARFILAFIVFATEEGQNALKDVGKSKFRFLSQNRNPCCQVRISLMLLKQEREQNWSLHQIFFVKMIITLNFICIALFI